MLKLLDLESLGRLSAPSSRPHYHTIPTAALRFRVLVSCASAIFHGTLANL